MKFILYDHAGKGIYLRQQLLAAGHEQADSIDDLDLLILDCDWPWAHPRPEMIASAVAAGAQVALYPHGGRPTVFVYDGIAQPDALVDLRLEHGPGSVEIAKHFSADGDLRQEATGWLYCPTRTFTPADRPARILFAPLHPNIEALQNGTNGHDPAPEANQRIYRRLLDLPNVEIVVSLVGPQWRSGLWAHPRARFAANPHMLFHHSFEQILSADLVVAAGTMLAASVALGKPTIGYCQDIFVDYINGEYVHAEHADLYRDTVRYPLDCEDAPLTDLIDRACGEEQTGWRDMWVGTDGTTSAVALLEALVAGKDSVMGKKQKKSKIVGTYTGKKQKDVTIVGATAMAGSKGGES